MQARERVSLALSHREPDRVPIDYWGSPETNQKLRSHYGFSTQEQVLDHFDVDFRYIEGPRYVGPEPRVHQNGAVEDHWGVLRLPVQVGSGDTTTLYREVINSPLAGADSLADLHRYRGWADPDWFDYECVREQVAEARQLGKVVVFMGDRVNRCAQLKPAMYLRGTEQILLDLSLAPEMAEYIIRRIAEFYLEYARRTFGAAGDGIDIFFTGDDFGTQEGMFISPQMWRRFLRPGFQMLVELGKDYGYRVAHHSCGSIKPIIPDLIDCGLDILNPIQPDVYDMDRNELKRVFGDRLCFHGSISIQRTLPFGSPEDVRQEVRERFASLGPGAGFVFCTAHNIQADTPIENIQALFDAYRELARYR